MVDRGGGAADGLKPTHSEVSKAALGGLRIVGDIPTLSDLRLFNLRKCIPSSNLNVIALHNCDVG